MPITGLDTIKETEGVVFHAGTVMKDGKFYTNGGRVLNVLAFGEGVKDAVSNVYRLVRKVNFENMYYRPDIGWRAQHRVGLI
jgi:phosphoribosylamine--glycine ligase